MNTKKFKFITDTATMCIFDLACLKHRLTDDADWWSIPSSELSEVNQGNAVFLNLGSDGEFDVSLDASVLDPQILVNFQVKSGKVFLGAGEEATGDGLEPEALRGGVFLELPIGNYALLAKRDSHIITLALLSSDHIGNTFSDIVRV